MMMLTSLTTACAAGPWVMFCVTGWLATVLYALDASAVGEYLPAMVYDSVS